MRQAILECTISIAVGIMSFAGKYSCETGCRKMPLQRLEPCAVKVASTVLRGLDAGNRVWLPDSAAQFARNLED
jgi:hypothetical protein